jgi:hypothetical protein
MRTRGQVALSAVESWKSPTGPLALGLILSVPFWALLVLVY